MSYFNLKNIMGYIPTGAKLTIWNDLYKRGSKPGVKTLEYSYKGKDVKKLVDFVPKLIQTIFMPTMWQQKEISVTEDTYEVYWYVFKDLDSFTYFRVDIEVKIDFKSGKAKIKLSEPVIVTEYPQETYWQKTFFYELLRLIWHNLFYNKKVEEYMDWAKLKISCFEEKLIKYFDRLKGS